MEQQQLHAQIPQPPDTLFVRENRKQTTGETIRGYFIEKIECIGGKGIFIHRVGATYPEKGWPTIEGLYALGQVKMILREFLKLCKSPLIGLGVLLYDRNKLMNQFILIYDKIYEIHVKKIEFLCPTAVATYQFLANFLIETGCDKEVSEQFAFRMAQIPDMDDAYRYLQQDLATEFKSTDNPKKEIERIYQIYIQREKRLFVAPKVKLPFQLLKMLLLFPKYKKAFIKYQHFIQNMKYDEGDWYWVCMRSEYEYGGIPYEKRVEGITEPKRLSVTL